MRVYAVWGAQLGDQAMRVLTYMALVARDRDAEPWFGLGHEAISELALGRPLNGAVKERQAALRAVRRAVTELHGAGAISTERRPTNQGRHVQYRLWLDGPAPAVDNPPSKPVDNPPSQDENRPITKPLVGRLASYDKPVVGRFVVTDRTKNVLPNRGGRGGSKSRSEETLKGDLRTASCGRRARDPP